MAPAHTVTFASAGITLQVMLLPVPACQSCPCLALSIAALNCNSLRLLSMVSAAALSALQSVNGIETGQLFSARLL